jgi:hypothetical protein
MQILAGIVIYLITVMVITGLFHVSKEDPDEKRDRKLKWLMENGYTFEQALLIVDAGE